MNNKAATVSVIAAGTLWGMISFFIRNLSAGGMDSMQISLIRMIVAAASFTLFVAIKDKSKLKIKIKDIWMFVGTGIISVVLFNCFYFYTMINSEVSVAVVLLYTSPVFIMVMSAILFKEKITVKKVAALIITIAGCVLVSGIMGSGYRITPIILVTGLGSGLFYGLYTIFGRYALEKYDSLTVTAYTFIFGLLGSIFIGKPAETFSEFAASPSLIIWGIGVGIVCTVLPYLLYTYGLQRMESGKAAILVAVEPLVGSLIGILFYKETCSVLKTAGICLILCAIILLNINSKKQEN